MARINKTIELLEQNQPVHYITTSEFTYENGRALAQTWADIIRLNLEHAPFNMTAVGEFMKGLVDGGPTKSGHKTPTVFAELPTDATNRDVMLANAWMVKQVLAQGVHGILLCHAESAEAVKVFIEACRYSFVKLGLEKGLAQGRRGHGGQDIAAPVWGIDPEEYLYKADVWPLNPEGELMMGVKIENTRCLQELKEILAVPGLSYAEWGPGDMGMSLGYPVQHDPPYPAEMMAIREEVKNVCFDNDLYFLNQVHHDDFEQMLDEGVMICKPEDEEVAAKCRKKTGRQMPW